MQGPADGTLFTVADEVFRDHVYEHPHAVPHGTVIDVGGNLGAFALWAAPSCERVIAFEAWPENLPHLRANVAANHASNVTVDGRAVSDHTGTVDIWDSGSSGGHLLFDHNIGGHLTSKQTVPSVTLHDALAEHDVERVGLLKMDCEGAEGFIVSAMSDDDLGRVDAVVMEYHDNVSILPSDQIAARFRASGMRVEQRAEHGPFGYLYAWR